MSDVLQPRQFFNKLADNYARGGSVHPSTFGLPVEPVLPGSRFSKVDPHEVEVPLHQVRAQQAFVYDKHVRNLATQPRESFEEIHAVPEVRQHHDGYYRLNEGTHRAAAAHVRGDKTLRVRVTGRWDKE